MLGKVPLRSGARPVRAGARSKIVLVVDDDAGHRAALADLLGERGHAVVEARHGHEVLEYLVDRRNPLPAVILLDLSMPVLTGWELLAILKGYQRLKHIPVVLISGAEPQLDPAIRANVTAYLKKPYTVAELLTALERALAAAPSRWSS